MQKLAIFLLSGVLLTSCMSIQPCPTYSYVYRNLNKGTYGCVDSNVLYHKGTIIEQIPDGTKFLILDVKLN